VPSNVKIVDGNFCPMHNKVYLHIIEEMCFLKFRIDINFNKLPPDSISHNDGQACEFGNAIAEKRNFKSSSVHKIIDKDLHGGVAYREELSGKAQ